MRPGWLALTAEAALEPALPILDPHHHLWDRADERYLVAELAADAGQGHDIRGTVFIQCASAYRAAGPEEERPLGETAWVAAQARGGFCAGIVGLVDLTLGERVTPLLEAHLALAPGRFRGVRNRTAWHPDPTVRANLTAPPPGPLGTPAFIAGARRLAALGLSLDVWCYHTQLGLVLEVARQVPELTLVLDHLGGPLHAGRDPGVFAAWHPAMAELARCPNVLLKLGGLAMEVGGWDFDLRPRPPGSAELAAAWRPWVETGIALFGPGRCMFESNFPVDKGMVGYGVLWNAFKRLAAGCSPEEKAGLFHGTAARAYRLDLPPMRPAGLEPATKPL
ncbi:amidohydrolase family protein [Roseococcus sp. DSY-14]|uniref:amidohydrolase family protein n=1 Tax=Roseococcus sp. DSY-14 TaxID=3369650 RepID=UPI00387B0BEF